MNWLVPGKIHTPPTEKISAIRRGGDKKLFLIIVNVLGHPKRVGGKPSISSVGVVWMFSEMTRNVMFVKYVLLASLLHKLETDCSYSVCFHSFFSNLFF